MDHHLERRVQNRTERHAPPTIPLRSGERIQSCRSQSGCLRRMALSSKSSARLCDTGSLGIKVTEDELLILIGSPYGELRTLGVTGSARAPVADAGGVKE